MMENIRIFILAWVIILIGSGFGYFILHTLDWISSML